MIPIDKKRINGNAKYAEWITDDGLLRIEGWARDGLIDAQIAHNMGISERSLVDWKNRFPAISAALKKGKAPVDIEVENALLKKALGYEYEETVTEITEGIDGQQRKHIRRFKRHMPPDVGAMCFWLKNRRPDKWRDKVEAPITADKNAPIFELLRRLDDECSI